MPKPRKGSTENDRSVLMMAGQRKELAMANVVGQIIGQSPKRIKSVISDLIQEKFTFNRIEGGKKHYIYSTNTCLWEASVCFDEVTFNGYFLDEDGCYHSLGFFQFCWNMDSSDLIQEYNELSQAIGPLPNIY